MPKARHTEPKSGGLVQHFDPEVDRPVYPDIAVYDIQNNEYRIQSTIPKTLIERALRRICDYDQMTYPGKWFIWRQLTGMSKSTIVGWFWRKPKPILPTVPMLLKIAGILRARAEGDLACATELEDLAKSTEVRLRGFAVSRGFMDVRNRDGDDFAPRSGRHRSRPILKDDA